MICGFLCGVVSSYFMTDCVMNMCHSHLNTIRWHKATLNQPPRNSYGLQTILILFIYSNSWFFPTIGQAEASCFTLSFPALRIIFIHKLFQLYYFACFSFCSESFGWLWIFCFPRFSTSITFSNIFPPIVSHYSQELWKNSLLSSSLKWKKVYARCINYVKILLLLKKKKNIFLFILENLCINFHENFSLNKRPFI